MPSLLWLLFIALPVLALWWLYRQPPQLQLERNIAIGGHQGRQLPLNLQLSIHSTLPVHYSLEVESPAGLVTGRELRFQGANLGTNQQQLTTTLKLNKRGVYQWPQHATVRWADPLGLFWRSQQLDLQALNTEVYPSRHGLQLPEILRPLLSEGGLSRNLGLDDPISLRGIRNYIYGDTPSRLHWRLSARRGELVVRELERSAASSLCVYIDQHGSEQYMESAVRLASSLIESALTINIPIAVASQQHSTPTGQGATELRLALLHLAQLASIQPKLEPTAQQAPEAAPLPNIRHGANVFILTTKANPQLINMAMRLRAKASRVSIVALPEGFYLEPGESPRPQWRNAPDSIRELERQKGVLMGAGILVYVLRGNQSILKLGA